MDLPPDFRELLEEFARSGVEAVLVGGYALQPAWGDGHDSGLYSFRQLRFLDPAEGGKDHASA